MIQGVRRKSATTEMTLSCGLIFFLRIKDRKDRAGSEVRHRRKMTRGRDKSGRLSTESGELGRGRRQAHSVLERTRFGRVCRWVLEDERTGGMSSCQQSGAGGGGAARTGLDLVSGRAQPGSRWREHGHMQGHPGSLLLKPQLCKGRSKKCQDWGRKQGKEWQRTGQVRTREEKRDKELVSSSFKKRVQIAKSPLYAGTGTAAGLG